MSQLSCPIVEAGLMNLIERVMTLYKRFKRAASSKSTTTEVDERIDLAIIKAKQAEIENRRVLDMFQETLDKLRASNHAR